MKYFRICLTLAIFGLVYPAFAQNTPAPASAISAPLPVANAQRGYFPALPPSRSCKPKDLYGGWKLVQVYENPTGQEATAFSAQPYQYLILRPNNTFLNYKSSYPENEAPRPLANKLNHLPVTVLQQYLMHESGFLFFYKNSVAVDTQACFIVADAKDPFKINQMLLMPPQGQSSTRLVKVYRKLWGPKPGVGKPNNQRRR